MRRDDGVAGQADLGITDVDRSSISVVHYEICRLTDEAI